MRCGLALQANKASRRLGFRRAKAPELLCLAGAFSAPQSGPRYLPSMVTPIWGGMPCRRRIEGHLHLRPVARAEIAGERAADGLLAVAVVQTTSTMIVSSPPCVTLGSAQLPPSGDRILSSSPMQVFALLVPLPAPMVVISQSPAFRRGTSSALAGSSEHKSHDKAETCGEANRSLHAILLKIVWKDRFSACPSGTLRSAAKGKAFASRQGQMRQITREV